MHHAMVRGTEKRKIVDDGKGTFYLMGVAAMD